MTVKVTSGGAPTLDYGDDEMKVPGLTLAVSKSPSPQVTGTGDIKIEDVDQPTLQQDAAKFWAKRSEDPPVTPSMIQPTDFIPAGEVASGLKEGAQALMAGRKVVLPAAEDAAASTGMSEYAQRLKDAAAGWGQNTRAMFGDPLKVAQQTEDAYMANQAAKTQQGAQAAQRAVANAGQDVTGATEVGSNVNIATPPPDTSVHDAVMDWLKTVIQGAPPPAGK